MVGPAKLWKMKRDFQIHFLRSMKLAPEHYLLDIGCGTLRGGVPIIQYLQESHYYGIEVREDALDEGRSELEEEALTRLRRFDPISCYFRHIWCSKPLFVLAPDARNRL
jgi:cyclopropane fatty-acyl-phospholipid synthase-like methyltransferase